MRFFVRADPSHRQIHCLLNPCIEISPSEAAGTTPGAPALSDAANLTLVPESPGDEGFPCAPEPAPPPRGRILLLDDDDSFREVIGDYLAENGYSVVAVRNGTEGVREVIAGDFTMILCDFMMPGLPGDMFYRAVEKTRPTLCTGFIFMTGHRSDGATHEFIQSVDGFVLRKPFPLRNLLDVIALAEVRRTFRSVFDGVPPAAARSKAGAAAARPPADQPHRAHTALIVKTGAGMASSAKTLPMPAKDSPARSGPAVASTPHEAALPARGGTPAFPLTLVAVVLLGLTAGRWNRYWDARDAATAASAERRTHEIEWAALSADLEKSLAERSMIEVEQSQRARITADGEKPRWTPALRGILLAPGAGIEFLEVQARGAQEESGSSQVRLHGVAAGADARIHADRFRQTVEDQVQKSASGRAVTTRFDRLEEVPGAQPDQKQADFVLNVTIGSPERPAAVGEEGR